MLLLLLLLPLLLVKLLLNHQLLYFGRLPPRSRLECAMSSGGLYASTRAFEIVEKKRQVVLTVPASIEMRTGGPWFWRFTISFDVMTGKAVCGFRSPRGWSGWRGTWTMSKCGRVVVCNVGLFSYVLKMRNMKCTSAIIRQKQLCDLSDQPCADHAYLLIQPCADPDSLEYNLI